MREKLNKVRRTDRQETETGFLHDVLENSMACTVAVNGDQFPLIHATFFDYDKVSNQIMFHFSKYGFGASEMKNDKNISISVYKYGRLYTAAKAVDFGCEYQSVIVYGKIRIVEEEQEKMEAMKSFFNKFFAHIPQTEYQDFTKVEANSIYVVKVKIDTWIGKQHLVPDKALKDFYADFTPVI